MTLPENLRHLVDLPQLTMHRLNRGLPGFRTDGPVADVFVNEEMGAADPYLVRARRYGADFAAQAVQLARRPNGIVDPTRLAELVNEALDAVNADWQTTSADGVQWLRGLLSGFGPSPAQKGDLAAVQYAVLQLARRPDVLGRYHENLAAAVAGEAVGLALNITRSDPNYVDNRPPSGPVDQSENVRAAELLAGVLGLDPTPEPDRGVAAIVEALPPETRIDALYVQPVTGAPALLLRRARRRPDLPNPTETNQRLVVHSDIARSIGGAERIFEPNELESAALAAANLPDELVLVAPQGSDGPDQLVDEVLGHRVLRGYLTQGRLAVLPARGADNTAVVKAAEQLGAEFIFRPRLTLNLALTVLRKQIAAADPTDRNYASLGNRFGRHVAAIMSTAPPNHHAPDLRYIDEALPQFDGFDPAPGPRDLATFVSEALRTARRPVTGDGSILRTERDRIEYLRGRTRPDLQHYRLTHGPGPHTPRPAPEEEALLLVALQRLGAEQGVANAGNRDEAFSDTTKRSQIAAQTLEAWLSAHPQASLAAMHVDPKTNAAAFALSLGQGTLWDERRIRIDGQTLPPISEVAQTLDPYMPGPDLADIVIVGAPEAAAELTTKLIDARRNVTGKRRDGLATESRSITPLGRRFPSSTQSGWPSNRTLRSRRR